MLFALILARAIIESVRRERCIVRMSQVMNGIAPLLGEGGGGGGGVSGCHR